MRGVDLGGIRHFGVVRLIGVPGLFGSLSGFFNAYVVSLLLRERGLRLLIKMGYPIKTIWGVRIGGVVLLRRASLSGTVIMYGTKGLGLSVCLSILDVGSSNSFKRPW